MYPVRLQVDQATMERNRLTTALRYFVALPWMIVGGIWFYAAYLLTIIAWFSLVFTGRYPQGIYDFNASFLRMYGRATGFYYLLTDVLPPFDGNPDDAYPIRVSVDGPQESYNRVSVFFRGLMLIPVYLVMMAVGVVAMVGIVVAWFAIVLNGRLSEDVQELIAKCSASFLRATAYMLLLTDRFPSPWDEGRLLVGGGDVPPAVGGVTPVI